MVLVEVDHVRLQPAEGRLERTEDVRTRPSALGAVAHRLPPLGREDDAAAASLQSTSDELLAPTLAAVGVGGVEERDARVDRGVDDRERLLLADPAAEVVAAEPRRRETSSGPSVRVRIQ